MLSRRRGRSSRPIRPIVDVSRPAKLSGLYTGCGPSSFLRSAYASVGISAMASTLPLFHLYGDPPDDQAFDFIHVETIASRSSIHDWTTRAHRHRNLFQILLLERGGGEMTFDLARLTFAAPAAILVPAAVAHGFRFAPNVTDGWVGGFPEGAAGAL